MNNTKIWIISGIVLVFLIVGFIFILDSKKELGIISQDEKPSETMLDNQSKEAAKATQALINDAKDRLGQEETENFESDEFPNTNNDADMDDNNIDPEDIGQAEEEPEPETVEVVENTSPINVETGEVVNDSGTKVDTSKDAAIEDAAHISGAISEEDLPENGIKLRMYIDKIEPAEFTVQAGQAINLGAIGMDDHFHSFKFKDSGLAGLFLSVVQGEVRSTTFNAPDKPGEYVYYDAMNNYEQRGATGIMIVE